MNHKTATIAAIAAILAVSNAMGADWKPIGSGNEKIDIDRSRIVSGADGLVTVWSRSNTPQALDVDGSYNTVEALNRYDCTTSHFVTLKRLYLRENTLIRAERVLVPREVSIAAGGVDAAILADVCKSFAQKNSVEVPKLVAITDVAHLQGTAKPLENAKESVPAVPLAPRRFLTLPTIDPSQIQHPTDEPTQTERKPVESAKKPLPKNPVAAIKNEAAKAGVSLGRLPMQSHHSSEIAMAFPALQKTSRPKPGTEDAMQSELRHENIRWGYEGNEAPPRWATLRDDYGLCDSGQRQSPIDIHEGIRVDLEPINFDYRPSQFRITDNGHTVQVNPGEGNNITVMGRTYRLMQLHFHRPSEERIDGRGFEMVMHLVHKDDEGHLAVVAVLLERGTEHPVIQTFWNNLPLETDFELAPATAVDPNKLLPEARTYYTYMGSLTTPPCSEGVLWMVMKQPLQVSPQQIAIFSRLYKNNARPIQASNGRLVKGNR